MPESTTSPASTAKPTPSHFQAWKARQTPLRILVYTLIGSLLALILIGGLLFALYSRLNPNPTPVVDDNLQLGVVVRHTGDQSLPLKKELDQNKLRQAVDAAWADLLEKAPKSAVNFPNDPDLVAIRYYQPGEETQTFVVYATQPIIIETEPVPSLPNNQPIAITLKKENYQLVAHLQYTPELNELDLEQVITDAFLLISNPPS